jgi:hypothetical protein
MLGANIYLPLSPGGNRPFSRLDLGSHRQLHWISTVPRSTMVEENR